MRTILRLLLLLPLTALPQAARGESAAEDYTEAGLLLAAPGEELYATAGHCGLRLRCPSKGIDYVYEFETYVDGMQVLRFLEGSAAARLERRHTADFLERYRRRGRSVDYTPLLLTPDEELALWQRVDDMADEGAFYPFDMIHSNCATMTNMLVTQSLRGRSLSYPALTPHLQGTFREQFPYIFRLSPWSEFVWNILMGTPYDRAEGPAFLIFPEVMAREWRAAEVRTPVGEVSPLAGETERVYESGRETRPCPVTPRMVMAAVFLLAVAATAADMRAGRATLLGRITDTLLFAVETIPGCLLLYLVCVSRLDGVSPNLMALLFSPVPLLLWLMIRKPRGRRTLYVVFAVGSLLFLLATPLVPQLRYSLTMLLPASFALRSGWHAVMTTRRLRNENKQ